MGWIATVGRLDCIPTCHGSPLRRRVSHLPVMIHSSPGSPSGHVHRSGVASSRSATMWHSRNATVAFGYTPKIDFEPRRASRAPRATLVARASIFPICPRFVPRNYVAAQAPFAWLLFPIPLPLITTIGSVAQQSNPRSTAVLICLSNQWTIPHRNMPFAFAHVSQLSRIPCLVPPPDRPIQGGWVFPKAGGAMRGV